MRVYVDVAFAVNGIIDYLLLRCSARLAGYPFRPWRLVAAAVFGGLFAACSFVWPVLQGAPLRLLAAALMLAAAFGFGRRLVRQGAMFAMVSLALAGLVFLVAAVFDWGMVILNQTAYYPVNARALLITAGVGYLAANLALRRCVRHTGGELLPVQIQVGGRCVQIMALRDTGNTLVDPLTGQSVLIVDWLAVRPLLPELQRQYLEQPVEHFAALAARMPALRWRLIPYRAVGVQGCLLAFQAELVQVDKQTRRRQTVALSPTPVSDGGGYMGLLGGIS